jgi:eukaryotic-like serine/threonine-protein kinase
MILRAGGLVEAYRLEKRLGSGGFAEVWSAKDERTGARVALKMLREPIAPLSRLRLARELRASSRVVHPRVCRVIEALPGERGIVFELLTGPSLAAALHDAGSIPAPRAMTMARDVLGALVAVHAQRIVHRDVAPANLVLDAATSSTKLIDFGVAKMGDDDRAPTLTTNDAVLGGLTHQSPEQIEDPRSVDGRADLYGLGSSLFLALTGRPPLRAPSAAALIVVKAECDPPSLAVATGRAWPAEIERFVGLLIARAPARRFPDARVALAELERILPALGA